MLLETVALIMKVDVKWASCCYCVYVQILWNFQINPAWKSFWMSISSVDNLKECCTQNQTGVMCVLWSNQTSLTQSTASIVLVQLYTKQRTNRLQVWKWARNWKKGCISFLEAQKLEPDGHSQGKIKGVLVCWVARGFPKTMEENSQEKLWINSQSLEDTQVGYTSH